MRLDVLVRLISFRYDNEWSAWRTISHPSYADPGIEETLELASGEEINSIAGFSDNRDFVTHSLQAETSTGRSWGPHGDVSARDGTSLRSSPTTNTGLRLHHISGQTGLRRPDQHGEYGPWREDKYILRWLPQYNSMKTV